MKLNHFEKLVLYCLGAMLTVSHPHISSYLTKCIRNGEITGSIHDGIRNEYDFIASLKERE